MNMMIIFFVPALTLNCEVYRFDQGYTEVWYMLPAADVFSIEELGNTKASVTKKYHYRLVVASKTDADSAVHEGIKSALVDPGKKSDYFIDYIPVFLSPGVYVYRLEITASGDRAAVKGETEIYSDTVALQASDLIISRKTTVLSGFAREGVELTPQLSPDFSEGDTMLVYIEAYGLVPDSLCYSVRYVIADTAGRIALARDETRLKHDYRQADTAYFAFRYIPAGPYRLHVAIFDPASNKMVTKSHGLKISPRTYNVDLETMEYAYEIETLVSNSEYRRFLGLDLRSKKAYLEAFWSERDYARFEERLKETDALFSTSNIAGHKTSMGRYYLVNGPPDEIEYRPMESSGNPSQIWHYHARGLDILFVDNDGDGDYDMLGNLGPARDAYRDPPGPEMEE